MKCPQCGAWTEVLETRGIKRRRECGNGHRFTTEEIVVQGDSRDEAERRRIAAEPGSSNVVGARYNINSSTVRTWRRKYLQEK